MTPPDRRPDLDALRVFAFAVLIFYHTGMGYVTWDWHVKSVYAGPVLESLMALSSPGACPSCSSSPAQPWPCSTPGSAPLGLRATGRRASSRR
jgi:hypothetical protein